MKRVLTIQDISCLGRCSTTIALPILSAIGIETALLPTALLSTHSLFKDFTFCDLSDQMQPITRHWKKEGVHFDAIYTGYLGTVSQIGTVMQILDDFRSANTFVFVDPVMGDNGKLYSGFDHQYVAAMEGLCSAADIIVPNITEACLLTGSTYSDTYKEDDIRSLLKALAKLGPKICILTGVSLEAGKTGVMGYDVLKDTFFSCQTKRIHPSYHGTGDLFASTCVGAMLRGASWQDALRLAVDYTAITIQKTVEDADACMAAANHVNSVGDDADRRFGVHFEKTIPQLISRCMEIEK